jgi:ATP-dependent RNA helicase HelY
MPTPAERYAASRQRSETPNLTAFKDDYPFGLDAYQISACRALEEGHGVLVAAPTGSGKTVVGEFAIHLALQTGRKCFYTTPIKALSNQKYHDLVHRYGVDRVGLLTGDTTINGEAPVVVMTTEVLRNMLYAQSSTLHGLGFVVMDEVHYLADRFRGAVWEEVIIHLPLSVTVVALSATVSNAEEFGDWLETVRGDTQVIVEELRPVPLFQHVMAGTRVYDLFVDRGVLNPELVRLARDEERRTHVKHDRRRQSRSSQTPWRSEVIQRLDRDGLLPCIYFLFSRAGCDEAVQQCLHAGLRLTSSDERQEIRETALSATLGIPDDDLMALGFDTWVQALERGLAAHHAGLLPVFKETIETLFQRGLVKAVFATETLALGINMPAKSVVIERLVKWNGETHVDLTPGEYTQLTGRAGRRGIDVEGHAVVLWQAGLNPQSLAGLASTRTYPLKSSFQPSYNMAVNLVSRMGRHAAREVLETSFAQFQADRGVVDLAADIRRLEEAREGYLESMTCHLGDFPEYAALREAVTRREKDLSRQQAQGHRDDAAASWAALRQGDVIIIPHGKRSGPAAIIDRAQARRDAAQPMVITAEGQVRRLSQADTRNPVAPVGQVRIPKSFNAKDARARRDLASAVREVASGNHPGRKAKASSDSDDQVIALRASIRQHPCHGCSDREVHARWAERYHRTERQLEELERRIKGRTNTIARRFDRICEVLADLDYLTSAGDSAEVTAQGRMLMRLYTEADLITAQSLRSRDWADLNPAELAAVCSAVVYESRRPDEEAPPPKPPTPALATALARLHDQWVSLTQVESRHHLDTLRRPDSTLVEAVFRWSMGANLVQVMSLADITAGDFVRWMRQVIDVLGQVAQAVDESDPLRATAHLAVDSIKRGVIAYVSA